MRNDCGGLRRGDGEVNAVLGHQRSDPFDTTTVRWLEDALLRARNMRHENARRAVSSYSGGYDAGWVEALEKVKRVLSTEGKTMPNIFAILANLTADVGDFKAGVTAIGDMVANLKAGHMPTASEIAAVEKVGVDLAKLAAAL